MVSLPKNSNISLFHQEAEIRNYLNRGRLVQDRVTKRPKLNCRNWECGVIVPIARTSGKKQPDSMDEFDDIVPVPMHTSPEPTYGLKKPWYYTEPSV